MGSLGHAIYSTALRHRIGPRMFVVIWQFEVGREQVPALRPLMAPMAPGPSSSARRRSTRERSCCATPTSPAPTSPSTAGPAKTTSAPSAKTTTRNTRRSTARATPLPAANADWGLHSLTACRGSPALKGRDFSRATNAPESAHGFTGRGKTRCFERARLQSCSKRRSSYDELYFSMLKKCPAGRAVGAVFESPRFSVGTRDYTRPSRSP